MTWDEGAVWNNGHQNDRPQSSGRKHSYVYPVEKGGGGRGRRKRRRKGEEKEEEEEEGIRHRMCMSTQEFKEMT